MRCVQFAVSLSGLAGAFPLAVTQVVSFRGCVAGEILVNNQCQQCANGYLMPYDPTRLSCGCPAGMYAYPPAPCAMCPAGTFAAAAGAIACTPCPTGQFSDPGSTACQSCAA